MDPIGDLPPSDIFNEKCCIKHQSQTAPVQQSVASMGVLCFAWNDLGVELGLAVLCIPLLLFLSALMSGSEISFFSLSPQQLEDLKGEDSKQSEIISRLLKKPDYLLATILIANNLFNIALILLSEYVLNTAFGFFNNVSGLVAFLINTVIITTILILVGEILPKIYANRFNMRFARFTALPINLMFTLFKPLSHQLVRSTELIQRKLKRNYNTDMKEVGEAIDLIADTVVPEQQASMLRGLAELSRITASQIMKPRVEVHALDDTWSFSEISQKVISVNYSRLPVYKNDLDEIVGMFYVKDLHRHSNRDENFEWQELIRKEIMFIPESKKLDDLMRDFKIKRQHMAIVVDEYGGTEGIVTLEDVVEQVVGEIYDAKDQETKPKEIRAGIHRFDANTPLIDVCSFYDISNDSFDEYRGESESIGGLLIELANDFPKQAQVFYCLNFRITVVGKVTKKVNSVDIEELPEGYTGEIEEGIPRAS